MASGEVAVAAGSVGEFETAADVGAVKHAGSTRFDAKSGEYRLTAGGANMWGATDAFHFASKRVSGDLALEARVAFAEAEGDPHRKAGLMVRASLDADAPYADAVVHADGLVSLQYRLTKGGLTHEIQSAAKGRRVRLLRDGDLFSFLVAGDDGVFHPAGAVLVRLGDDVHAGLAACSHDDAATTTALVTGVRVEALGVVKDAERVVESTLEVIDVATGVREAVYTARANFEAPNWSRDGSHFVFNQGGRLYRLPRQGGTPEVVDTGFAVKLNNDHGLSPDGEWLVISDQTRGASTIYHLPARGGTPRQVTAKSPSYWHGWSPDGKTLAYCAERNGNYDVYTIATDATNSVEETRLTTADGLDDGPDYSPDGKTIYFNSFRSGRMAIWRMNADGSDQRQMTNDEEFGDWFAHPSPDGKTLVFVSFHASVGSDHPPNKEVALRTLPAEGGEAKLLTRLFGGQGTINVPSWSPDSRSVAFVSYRLVKP
jgi:tricorn protease-like protein